jgi:hypothetical protein
VCGKCGQHLPFLLFRHAEVVERSRKFRRDFIEDGGRDRQFAMSFLQAERGSAGLRRCVFLRAAGDVADPERAHEFEARKPVEVLSAPFV